MGNRILGIIQNNVASSSSPAFFKRTNKLATDKCVKKASRYSEDNKPSSQDEKRLLIFLYEEMKEMFQKTERQLQEDASLGIDCYFGAISSALL